MDKITTTQFLKGRCLFNSCHASLEYDMADLFKTLGIKIVKANNDRAHGERPCIPGYNDMDYGDDLRNKIDCMSCSEEDFVGINFIFMMNNDQFQHRVPHMARFRPVILYLFGQHTDLQLDEFAGKMNNQIDKGIQPNIFTVCYGKREHDYLMERLYEQVKHRLYYIRFAKRLEHYAPWKIDGSAAPHRLPFVFTASNSIQNRGDQCGWPDLQIIRSKLPHLLTGHETEVVQGTGRITFDELRQLYSICGAYVTFPAWPAPLVMNLMEGMLAGCPTAFLDNARGAKEEGLFNDGVGCLSTQPNDLYEYCKRVLGDKGFQKEQSERCQQRAIEFFEFSRNLKRWESLFLEMQKLW
jgi:hypothetical protein